MTNDTKKKSEISGQGYGDSHTWERGETAQVGAAYWDKGTIYACECGASFRHAYDLIPDIFEAIKQSGVVDKCPLNKEEKNL